MPVGHNCGPAALITPSFCFFVSGSGDHRDLHSFPTRRSSDLSGTADYDSDCARYSQFWGRSDDLISRLPPKPARSAARSEEHTSELQSRGHLVCRLLLEKKKKTSPAQFSRPPTAHARDADPAT